MTADPSGRTESPAARHDLLSRLHLGAARVAVAGALLVASELVWLLALGYALDAARLAALASAMLGLALLAKLGLGAALTLARPLGRARACWLLALAASPLAWMAADRMFSGNAIREVSGVVFMKAGFALALVVAVRVGLGLYAAVESWRRPGQVVGVVVAGVAVMLALGWADNHIQVGLYPVFHQLLALSLVLVAAVLSRALLAPTSRPPAPAGWALAAAVLVALPYTSLRWQSPETRHLVTYTNGLAPKLRHAWTRLGSERTVLARDGVGGLANLDLSTPWEPSAADVAATPAAPSAPVPQADVEGNLLRDPAALDGESWQTGGHAATIVPDDGLAPDGTLSAELVKFAGTGISTVVQGSDVPAAGGSFEAAVWVKLARGEPDSRVRLMLMDGRGGKTHGEAFTPTDEWQQLHVAATFRESDRVGNVTLRLGNDHTNPTGVEVWVWGARVLAAADRDSAQALLADVPPPVKPGERPPAPPLPASDFRFVPTPGPEMERVRAATRSVVFVLMDAFRADHLGRLEDGVSLSPAMDAFAAENVQFTQVYSPSDHTGRSMPSVMTSLPLPVVNKLSGLQVPMETWLTHLGDAGVPSFSNGSNYVSRKYKHILVPYCFGSDSQGTLDPKSPVLEQEVLDHIDARGGEPFVVYTHWSDVHIERVDDMPALYRSKVREVDGRLERLVAGLQERGVWDETLVIVTADHGYSLGEQNRYLGGQGCSETATRVPLLMHVPGLDGPARFDEPVSSHQVTATILDVLAPETAALLGGESLFRHLVGERDPARPAFASTGAKHLLRVGDQKLIIDEKNDTALLFDLARDPEERDPIFDDERTAAMVDHVRAEFARQARLAQQLVGRHRAELHPDVLSAFLVAQARADDVEPLVLAYWSFNDATRRFLLESLYKHDLQSAALKLGEISRERFEDADQALLVLRAWAGDTAAGRELDERYDELGEEGRRWLADLAHDFPKAWIADRVDAFVDELEAIAAREPAFGTPDERFLTLMLHAIPRRLHQATPQRIERLIVKVFNEYSREALTPSFSTLRTNKFVRRDLLSAFRDSVGPEDVPLLRELARNRDVAIRVPEMVEFLDARVGRDLVLELLEDWPEEVDPNGVPCSHVSISYMLPSLREMTHVPDFQREANRLVQQRWPRLPEFGPDA